MLCFQNLKLFHRPWKLPPLFVQPQHNINNGMCFVKNKYLSFIISKSCIFCYEDKNRNTCEEGRPALKSFLPIKKVDSGAWLMKHDLLVTTKTSNCVLATRKYSVFGSQNVCVRYYVSRKKQKETKSTEELESDEEEEMDDDEEEEVDLLPKGWKNIVQVVPSLRLDSVLSSGLGIARKKVEDAFLKSRLLVNNERVSKKSKMVKAGDVLDMIRDDDNDNIVMRVVVLKVASEKTSKNQIKIKLRRWKKLDLQGEESKT